MKRALLLVVPLVACHDWDTERNLALYRILVADGGIDAGRDAGTDAGHDDAGTDAGTDAGMDAGLPACTAAFCQLDFWIVGDSVSGASMTDLHNVGIGGDVGTESFFARSRGAIVADGGSWAVTKQPTGVKSSVYFNGLGADDLWLWLTDQGVRHMDDGGSSDPLSARPKCGFQTASWNGVVPRSHDEAWFVGQSFALCRWTRDGGAEPMTPTANSGASHDLQWAAFNRDGQLVAVDLYGGLFFTDGGSAGALPTMTPGTRQIEYDSNGELWARWARESVGHQRADGGWQLFTVGDALTDLWALTVVAPDDVWLAGTGTLQHFTGGAQFDDVLLPGIPAADETRFYGVTSTGPKNLVVSGQQTTTSVSSGFVTRYQRP